MKKRLLLVLLALFFVFLAGAQETKPVIRFSPLYTKGIGFEETRFIESLIQSYLSDFGEVVNLLEGSFAGFDSLTRTPDYVLSGSVYLERDFRIFTLEIHNTQTGETSSATSTHKTAGDLVLKARSLVEMIFNPGRPGPPGETGEIPEEKPEIITERSISGTWRGEPGIETVYLQQGRGVAFFSSGARMNLSYTIENNTLKITQNSPNTERFYYPLPFEAAKQLSAEAVPMTWELFLYSGGTCLRGVKISTEARIEDNEVVEFLPGSVRETEWFRTR
jgi:hypothetical protein